MQQIVDSLGKNNNNRFKGWGKASVVISEMLRRFLMGYTIYFNGKYHRKGSLFRKRFRRKEITTNYYLQNIVAYIHRNPNHHGLKIDYKTYKWSSYSDDYEKHPPNGICIELLRLVYDSVENYRYFHEHINVPEDTMEE